MKLRRYALGASRILECDTIHALLTRRPQGCEATIMITQTRSTRVLYTGRGAGATCAEAIAAARRTISAPVPRVPVKAWRQLPLFEGED